MPPIRPLETLHNALSLRKLDSFLQDMILAQIFKTPTGSPPRVHDAAAVSTSRGMSISATMQVTAGVMSMSSVNPADGSSILEHPAKHACDDSQQLSADSVGVISQTSCGETMANESQLDTNDMEMKRIMSAKKQRKFHLRESSIIWHI